MRKSIRLDYPNLISILQWEGRTGILRDAGGLACYKKYAATRFDGVAPHDGRVGVEVGHQDMLASKGLLGLSARTMASGVNSRHRAHRCAFRHYPSVKAGPAAAHPAGRSLRFGGPDRDRWATVGAAERHLRPREYRSAELASESASVS